MKKILACVIMAVLVLGCLTGCSTEFAAEEYDDNEKIAKTDHNVELGGSGGSLNDIMTKKSSKFNGRTTLGEVTVGTPTEIDVILNMSCSDGKAKLVLVDCDDNVYKIYEITPENNTTDGYVEGTMTVPTGRNKIKLVGVDCKDLVLEMSVTGCKWE